MPWDERNRRIFQGENTPTDVFGIILNTMLLLGAPLAKSSVNL